MIETKDGQLFKDGAPVGVVDGNKLVVPEKLHHKTREQIERETGLTVEVDPAAGNPATPPSTADPGPLPLEPPAPPEPPAPKVEEPEPLKDHRGDKTPAFVEWLFRNRPEEAAKRYANRRIAR